MAKADRAEVLDRQFIAVQQQNRIKPAFTVKKLHGTVDHKIHAFDKENNKIVEKVVQEDAGYLVKFARGHSIRCRDEAHLKRIGAGLRMVPLVDTETGEIKGVIENTALEDA